MSPETISFVFSSAKVVIVCEHNKKKEENLKRRKSAPKTYVLDVHQTEGVYFCLR